MLPIILEKLTLSPEAKKFLPPAPPPARMMAAKGLAPLGPVDLVTVQTVLTADEDAKVAEAARAAVVAHPEPLLKAAAEGIKDAAILDFLSYCAVPASVKEAILLNKAVADETLQHIAKSETDAKVLDILSNNQARMLACTDIAENLIDNPALSFSTKKRLEEFFVNDFAAKVLAEPEPTPAAPGAADDFAAALAALPQEGDAALGDLFTALLDEQAAPLTPAAAPAVTTAPVDEAEAADAVELEPATEAEAGEEEEEKEGGLYKQILSMKVSHKIKLALKGNKEARGILIKDSNKMVCTSVLKNPRISEGEVATIAGSKSAIEDLLRLIGANNQWMRNYQIKLALINNPKCPAGISAKILPQLFDKDLNALAKSKGIPGALRQNAERLKRARAQKKS